MNYEVKLTDQQIKDKTTYQFVVDVVIKKVTTKPDTYGTMSDTTDELARVTSTRDHIVTAIEHAQVVLSLELPKGKM